MKAGPGPEALEGAGGWVGTITLKVRRRASAGQSRMQRGESRLQRRSVRESGTITLKRARHRRRLCPVGPHIQKRLLIAPPFIVG